MLYYSAAAGGFFDDAINVAIPDDAVQIEPAHHAALMRLQSQGEIIVPGPGGAPMAVSHPGLTPEELGAALREQRSARLAASDWTQLPDAQLTDAARAAWRTYRQALRDLPETMLDAAAIEWPKTPEID